MQRNCKHVSLILSLVICISSFAFPFSASAGEYTETVEEFTYNGFVIPAYDGDYYEELNGNVPSFTDSDLTQNIYETYGELDSLGRVSVCEANIDQSLMPTGSRESISSVYPTGWKQKQYDFVNGKYLYNRSHLIGWQLTGENANKNNLMTGTRSFNATGMLKFENEVADYVKEDSENNVLYRVTPVFQGDNLLASGVIMEAESVDDLGSSVSFCVFVYNVENGVKIDYETGDNIAANAEEQPQQPTEPVVTKQDISSACIYLSALKFTYTGKEIRPLEYVKYKDAVLTYGTDYNVSYSDNINAGTATVTVTGYNGFTGSVSKTFKIVNPKPPKPTIIKVKPKKTTVTVKWKKLSNVSGYKIQYSTNKRFRGAKTVFVNSKSARLKKIKKLERKKVYYVRVCSYKTVNNTKFFSKWTKYEKIKTK